MSVIDRMVDTIAGDCGVSKATAREIVGRVFGLIEGDLIDGGECKIPKFGTFALTERAAGEGHNPRTGEKIHISAQTGIRFKPASSLKGRFNQTQS